MFSINKKSEYAILFLAHMAGSKNNQPIRLKFISQKLGLPYKFMSQIVLKLKKNGILKSKKGVNGGYFLAKKFEKISLFDIIKAVEDKKGLVSCISKKCALEKKCFHKQVWIRLQLIFNRELEKIKLNHLIPLKRI